MDILREDILDLWKNPLNYGNLKNPNKKIKVLNPFCGDEINLEIKEERGVIKEIAFTGQGCAISRAFTSLLTEKVKGEKIEDVKNMTKDDVLKLLDINISPSRIKCALLPLEAIKKAC